MALEDGAPPLVRDEAMQRLLVDCDPGLDDAVALLLARGCGDLVGVTTVAGNGPIEVTTRNAEWVCRVIGYSGDLVSGAARPLVGELGPPSECPFPVFKGRYRAGPRLRTELDAAGFISEQARTGTWLIATGPLTNVALALRRDPGLAGRLTGISIMGGTTCVGNVTPVSEFNIWCDPEAAHIVFSAGLPIRLCGLDVTNAVLVDREFVTTVRRLKTGLSSYFGDLLETFIETYPDAFVGQPVAPLHDPCATLAAIRPDLFQWRDLHAAVELVGSLTRGMTVCDRRDTPSGRAPNVQFAVSADRDAILAAILQALRNLGELE